LPEADGAARPGRGKKRDATLTTLPPLWLDQSPRNAGQSLELVQTKRVVAFHGPFGGGGLDCGFHFQRVKRPGGPRRLAAQIHRRPQVNKRTTAGVNQRPSCYPRGVRRPTAETP